MACSAPLVDVTPAVVPAQGIRATRFMMEGVGARVIRGPDWKWGKQVLKIIKLV